jgi:regulator of nucleoside diphosphate kinase
MGSTVEFRSDTGQQRRVTLVYPGEADFAQGRISILTPIGAALIGLSPGQSIAWTSRDGRQHRLTVLSVAQPHVTTG